MLNNEIQKEKLKHFVNDDIMMEAVKNVIEEMILKPTQDRDVQNLAARFTAIEILRDAFKEFDNYKGNKTEDKPVKRENLGL